VGVAYLRQRLTHFRLGGVALAEGGDRATLEQAAECLRYRRRLRERPRQFPPVAPHPQWRAPAASLVSPDDGPSPVVVHVAHHEQRWLEALAPVPWPEHLRQHLGHWHHRQRHVLKEVAAFLLSRQCREGHGGEYLVGADQD